MLGALALALAPTVARLPPWVTGIFLGAALWRLAVQQLGWRLPPGWLRLGLALAGVLGVLATYRTFNGLEAGGALLVVMGAMKLLETRTRRDVQVLSFIGFFIVMMQLLHDQPIWSLPWLLVTVAAITFALLQGVRGGEPLPWRSAGALVLRMLAFAAPVALVMFLLFPRVPGPFWALPARGAAGLTGLSDEMSPGMISQLIQSDEVAFRVSFEGPEPPQSALYWRGPVLERFDGSTWRDLERLAAAQPAHAAAWPVLPLPHHPRAARPCLAARLDFPARWSDRDAMLTNEFQLVSRRPIDSALALEIESWPEASPEPELSPLLRFRNLQLPEDRNPRSMELAVALRAAAGSDAAFVDAVLGHFPRAAFRLHPAAAAAGQRAPGGRIHVPHAARLLRALRLGLHLDGARGRRARHGWSPATRAAK
jgi:protein-glutamine gamma-glutamyltransferase